MGRKKVHYPDLERKFKDLNGKVTTAQKMEAALILGCHPETVNRYLRGQVGKGDFGAELYDLLTDTADT